MKTIKSLEELSIEITGECPVACAECPYRCNYSSGHSCLGLSFFLEVHGVDEIERVIFTGGDPLLVYASIGSCIDCLSNQGVKVGSYSLETSGLVVHASAVKTIMRCILESDEDENNPGCAISIYGGSHVTAELERHGLLERRKAGVDKLTRIFRDRVKNVTDHRPEKPDPGFLYIGAMPDEYYLSGSGLCIRANGDITWGRVPGSSHSPEVVYDNVEELEKLVDELLKRKVVTLDE